MTTESHPVMVLSLAPLEPSRFSDFFSRSGVMQLLQQPGGRYAGFDLQTDDQARIVRGELLEVGYPHWKLVQLYEDGTLLAKVSGGDDFLAWAATGGRGRPFWEQPKLNPLALIEFILSFVTFYAKVVRLLTPMPQRVRFRAEFKPLMNGEAAVFLSPFGIGSIRWQSNMIKYAAKEAIMERQFDADVATVVASPERIAYLMVERIYTWFGASADEIPYVTGTGDTRTIDAASIERGGKGSASG